MKHNSITLDIATWSGLIIFATSSVIIPICLPEIRKSIPATLSESGTIETIRNFVVLIILLLAGFLVQLWSKKRFIAQGQFLIALGLLLVSFSQSYLMLVTSILVMGLGGGLSEAFLNPIIVDIHPQKSGKYLNLSNAFYPIGIIASAFIFGELLTMGYSWRIVFRIASAVALLVAIFFNVLHFPTSKKNDISSWHTYKLILKMRGFWLFAVAIFLGGGIESALTFWGRSYVQEYLSDIPRAGAIAIMLFAMSMAVGRLLTAYISVRITLKNILLGSTLLGIGIGFLLPLTTTLLEFYSLIMLAGLATACFWPTILAEANSSLKVNTTILFILLACTGVIGFGITPLIMGIIGDVSNLRVSFIIVPIFFIALFIILIIEKRFTKKMLISTINQGVSL
ncbi:MAG: MFS transporter [Ignavibacteriae bacterium]|nr:MFS transporter [Ignavibacteriota bacterium]